MPGRARVDCPDDHRLRGPRHGPRTPPPRLRSRGTFGPRLPSGPFLAACKVAAEKGPSAGVRRPRSPCLVGRESTAPTIVVCGGPDMAPALPHREYASRATFGRRLTAGPV